MKRIFALLLALGLLCAALPILAEGDASGETKEDWMAVVKSTAAGSINLRPGHTFCQELSLHAEGGFRKVSVF